MLIRAERAGVAQVLEDLAGWGSFLWGSAWPLVLVMDVAYYTEHLPRNPLRVLLLRSQLGATRLQVPRTGQLEAYSSPMTQHPGSRCDGDVCGGGARLSDRLRQLPGMVHYAALSIGLQMLKQVAAFSHCLSEEGCSHEEREAASLPRDRNNCSNRDLTCLRCCAMLAGNWAGWHVVAGGAGQGDSAAAKRA